MLEAEDAVGGWRSEVGVGVGVLEFGSQDGGGRVSLIGGSAKE